MTRLQFKIPQIDAPSRSAPALPVNVYRANDFAMVSRSVTDEDVLLSPGDYVAVVHFPNGGEAFQAFQLSADTESTAIELRDAAHAIRAQVAAYPVKDARWTSPLPYDFIDFNPFRTKIDVFHQKRSFRHQTPIRAPSGDRWRYLAVAPEGPAVSGKASAGKTFLMAIPAAEEARVTVTVNLDHNGRPLPSFVLPRAAATLLYRYLSTGIPEAAMRLSGSEELCALDLVENKAEDPVAGALGMYLLLGSGRLDKIGERSEKLYRYNPALADGAIIWAEHLARLGRHKDASEVLSSLRERGVPVLTVGFRTALSRISSYVAAHLAAERLADIGKTLRHWAARTVPNSPTTVLELDDCWLELVRQELHAAS
ncbi:hypothetical protein ABIA85_006564 [Bradyrhizobium sp. LA6.10]|uniref:hypothetical protein n=1 Tax=Bradyrhizobium sp. LA6.10 TaxID=3156318 RepID=UPI00339239AE